MPFSQLMVPAPRSPARLAAIGMAVAVVGLGALTVWTAISSQNRAARLTYAGVQTSGYLRATQALGQLNWYADLLEDDPATPAIEARLASASRVLDDALARMEHGGYDDARRLAHTTRSDVKRLTPALARLVEVSRSGNAVLIEAVDQDIDRRLRRFEQRFDDFDSDPSGELRAEAAAAVDSARSALWMAIVLVPTGLVGVFGCFWLVQGYRRRSEAAILTVLRRHESDALTDHLTGLANRRALIAEMDGRLADGDGFVVALADLNGFKHYNDTFGHAAGDSLLRRLAQRLRDVSEGDAVAARLGGDEFCVIAQHGTSLVSLEARIVEALGEEGHGFSISSACGVIRVPEDATSVGEALRRADARMYAAKPISRPASERDMSRALLRMLDERHPGLGQHVQEVARLAEACAAELGVPSNEIETIRQAAELHDIGKVAIPDTILHKAGMLDAEEWDFMRKHTLIGERVLSLIPSMEEVARLVRWSHERWDATGYPDRIGGEQIPLGARILAVTDAYSAMSETRSYCVARSGAEAILELRRCSGSQFDPRVVEAFVASLAASEPLSLAA